MSCFEVREYEEPLLCPHCGTVELKAEAGPRWATDQVERWAWTCTGCGYVYVWDEVWPLDDHEYEITAWEQHIDLAREKLPHWDQWQLAQLINEPFPFCTFFADPGPDWGKIRWALIDNQWVDVLGKNHEQQ